VGTWSAGTVRGFVFDDKRNGLVRSNSLCFCLIRNLRRFYHHSAQLCTTISNRSEHGHDVLRHLLAPRQQHQERQEDQQQRTPLPRLVNLRHVILRRELGSALADQHVQRPRQRQAGRDDTEREAEVDAQRRQPESPAPEPVLDNPTAVDLTHGEHVQRLGHEAAPVNEDVGGGWSAMDRIVFWIIWSFGYSYDAGWKSSESWK